MHLAVMNLAQNVHTVDLAWPTSIAINRIHPSTVQMHVHRIAHPSQMQLKT